MNVIFTIVVALSSIMIAINNPDKMLSCFSLVAENSINLTVKLTGIYLIWLGFTEILSGTKLSEKLSKIFKPIIKFLFLTDQKEAVDTISLALSCNMLGLGGVATPMAIDGMKLLDDKQNEKGKTMLFVISATSIQILPTTVMQLLIERGATNPSAIFIPTIIGTAISTAIGIVLTKILA